MSVLHRRGAAALATTVTVLATAVLATASPAGAAGNSPKVPGGEPTAGPAFLVPGDTLYRPSADHPAANRLFSVGLSATSDSTYAPTNLGAYLVLQKDGNLVEYETNTGAVLWTSHTTTGNRLVFQGDHNVVLYDASNRALWNTRTAGSAAAFFGPYGNGELVTQRADGLIVSRIGTALTPTSGVVVSGATSPNGAYSLAVQSDGNLVEYVKSLGGGTTAVWQTHTAGKGPVRLAAQSDGNLVLYSRTTGKALWSSGTASSSTAYRQLDVQDNGALVLWTTDGTSRLQQIWSQTPGS